MLTILYILSFVASVFGYSGTLSDANILPKWIYGGCVISMLLLSSSFMLIFRKGNMSLSTKTLCAGVVIICLAESIIGLLQFAKGFPNIYGNLMIGTFDNVAGFASCVCAEIPFGIYLVKNSKCNMKWKRLFLFAVLLQVISVILSCCRAGWLVLLLFFIVYMMTKTRKKTSRFWAFSGISLVVSCVIFSSLAIKEKSAMGRLLIWRVSSEMVKEAPFWGHGYNAIERKYMYYQAKYFQENSNACDEIVADNVKHLFCEPLEFLVRYGILGILVLICFIGCIVNIYLRNRMVETNMAMLTMTSIGVFSLFSYPFMYLHIWLLLSISISILVSYNVRIAGIFLSPFFRYTAAIVLLFGSVIIMQQIRIRYKADSQWFALYNKALRGDDVLNEYNQLGNSKKTDPYFLYNYATELYLKDEFAKSLKIAYLCKELWADYDLELLLGYNYAALNNYKMAREHFVIAQYMCPNRFEPLYQLAKVEEIAGKKDRAKKLAKIIIDKKVKIPSADIQQIKKEMEDLYNQY